MRIRIALATATAVATISNTVAAATVGATTRTPSDRAPVDRSEHPSKHSAVTTATITTLPTVLPGPDNLLRGLGIGDGRRAVRVLPLVGREVLGALYAVPAFAAARAPGQTGIGAPATPTPAGASPAGTAATTAPPPATQTAPTAATSTSPPPPPVTNATSTTTPTWQCIRVHESGDRYNTATAPSGAYGMLLSTWASLGFSGWPYQYPASVQNTEALYLYGEFGWQPWSTKTVCGL